MAYYLFAGGGALALIAFFAAVLWVRAGKRCESCRSANTEVLTETDYASTGHGSVAYGSPINVRVRHCHICNHDEVLG